MRWDRSFLLKLTAVALLVVVLVALNLALTSDALAGGVGQYGRH